MTSGLEGVCVAETSLSDVDGERGRLVIAGQRLEQFSQHGFERAAQLLLGDVNFGEGREQAYGLLKPWLGELAKRTRSLDALRVGLSLLGSSIEDEVLVGAFPVILSAHRHGASLASPDARAGQVEDFLRLFHGRSPRSKEVRALSTYLVTVSEHGMNASTFTARVIASTGATTLDAVLGALGALAGPLHGGAPGPVLDLLDELEGEKDLIGALGDKVKAGERLMGFGHRVYRARDPRADVLREALSLLPNSPRLRWAEQVEGAALAVLRQAKPNRPLQTNVEYYTALLLNSLGFSRDDFTSLFATGRVLGWIAHVKEQKATGRLIRPLSRYIGPSPVDMV